MDFDGVFTNNLVFQNNYGEEFVQFSREDGMGLEMLRIAEKFGYINIHPVVITREFDGPAVARCEKLKIRLFSGIRDKKKFLEKDIHDFKEYEHFALSQTIYLGNDINDVQIMKSCKISIVPKDAHPIAKQSATYISLNKSGGLGFIREVTDTLLRDSVANLVDDLAR